MEAVARSKAGLPSASETATAAGTAVSSVPVRQAVQQWLPGLLQVSVNGRPSDLLGVGDVVFPAMLSGWARRWDCTECAEGRDNPGLYGASVGGFALGCVACELLQTGGGQPALIYLVPAMSTAVLLQGARKKQLGRMWEASE
eukprot:gnl/TRDRNA2_/TRDRNA2_124862_c3_seq2.p1 gnl/TRDRNA2_/TRDRNA2_124862_c3~~gnl/TRDRNA2_/TRDRNA2_124862_c3_seq2.p1  ORF type:complete len:166 (+),score=27.75 gnl/TRDRNA2_/TRDRNA2_124862_c3_seq2:70-498(+)